MIPWKEILLAVVSGSLGAAIVKLFGDSLAFKRERKAKKEDTKTIDMSEWQKKVDKQLAALCEAQKLAMYDRIRYLGQEYIKHGEIEFDDRRVLNDMHNSYHCGLGGNGDLDKLMKTVNELPLKIKKEG